MEHRIRAGDGSHRWFLVRAEPHRDAATGEIVRWFGASTDTHDRRPAEERQAFLLRLSDGLRPLARPAETPDEAIRILAGHRDASRAHSAEREPDGEHAVMPDDQARSVPDRAGRYRLHDFRTLIATCREGRDFIVPLVKVGRLDAILAVHFDAPHAWTATEVALIEDAADRVWAALERARAETALRDAEARFRAILETADDYAIFTTDPDGLIEASPPTCAGTCAGTASACSSMAWCGRSPGPTAPSRASSGWVRT